MKNFRWIIFSAIILLLTTGQTAYSQVFVDVGKVELDMSPGETVEGKILVTSSVDDEILMKAYWEDFGYKAPYDGSKDFFPAGTRDDSMSEDISISPQTFTLPPRASREIRYVIRTPEDFSGGKYGVLFLEQDKQGELTDTGVKIITRVGTLFFVESVDKNVELRLEDVTIDGDVISVQLNNAGNTILIPKGIYYLLDAEGLVADRGDIANLYLASLAQANSQITIDPDLGPGRYTAVVTFDLGRQYTVVKEIDLEKASTGSWNILAIRN